MIYTYYTHKSIRTIQALIKLSFCLSIVSFDSDGPLFIPINTHKTINCSSTEDFIINRWLMILSDGTEVGVIAARGNVERFGITGLFMTTLLQLIVDTPNTAIIGLRCVGVETNNMGEITSSSEADINITIYGKC